MAAHELIDLRTAQWNIGGAKIRPKDADPEDPTSYSEDGLNYIVDTIGKYNPSIVTLQEVEGNKYLNQARDIALQLKIPFYHFMELSPSHFTPGQNIGIAILSQFPIGFPQETKLKNPNWTHLNADGTTWSTFDKGILKARLQLSYQRSMLLATLHGYPPHVFNQSFTDAENFPLLIDIRDKIQEDREKTPVYLVQGDFNIDTRSAPVVGSPPINRVLSFGLSRVHFDQPTLYSGEIVDQVAHRGLEHLRTRVHETRADHNILISDFQLTT